MIPAFAPVYRKDEAPGLYGIPSFYPTPDETTALLLQAIPVYPGDILLEPSAGDGQMAQMIRQVYPRNRLWVIERNPTLRQMLTDYELVGEDFLRWRGKVNVIFGNPPFSNGYQDIDHFVHAWDRLLPGGRIAMLVHYFSAFNEEREKPAQFIRWMKQMGIRRVALENAFVESRQPTSVKVALLYGVKP